MIIIGMIHDFGFGEIGGGNEVYYALIITAIGLMSASG